MSHSDDTRIRMIVRCGFASGYTKEYIKEVFISQGKEPPSDAILDEVFDGDQNSVKDDLLNLAKTIEKNSLN